MFYYNLIFKTVPLFPGVLCPEWSFPGLHLAKPTNFNVLWDHLEVLVKPLDLGGTQDSAFPTSARVLDTASLPMTIRGERLWNSAQTPPSLQWVF